MWSTKKSESASLKYSEIIADNLHKAGRSLGSVSALDVKGRTIWIVDAHGYGKRFIVRADEKTAAFMELELLVPGRGFSEFSRQIFLPIGDHEMPPLLGLQRSWTLASSIG